MGELHLEIARDRLVNDFKAKASMGRIEIGYRECISGSSEPTTMIFDREIAGRKGMAGCTVELASLYDKFSEDEADEAIIFREERDGNRITIRAPGLVDAGSGTDSSDIDLPAHLTISSVANALQNGCLAALARGPRFSFPVHSADITVTFDPSQHLFGADTTTSALSAAARLATQAAVKSLADTSSMMEPVMKVTITLNERHIRRARWAHPVPGRRR
jgi:elongation factor G